MSPAGEGNTGLSRNISETETGPTESENLSMCGHSMFEYREVSAVPTRRRVGRGRSVTIILKELLGVGLRSGGKLAGIATEP